MYFTAQILLVGDHTGGVAEHVRDFLAVHWLGRIPDTEKSISVRVREAGRPGVTLYMKDLRASALVGQQLHEHFQDEFLRALAIRVPTLQGVRALCWAMPQPAAPQSPLVTIVMLLAQPV